MRNQRSIIPIPARRNQSRFRNGLTLLQKELLKLFRDHPAFPWSEKDLAIVLRRITESTREDVREALRDPVNRSVPLVVESSPFHWESVAQDAAFEFAPGSLNWN